MSAIGAVYDSSGSYQALFFINASIYFMAAVLYTIIILLNRHKPQWCYPIVVPTNDHGSECDTMKKDLNDVAIAQIELMQEAEKLKRDYCSTGPTGISLDSNRKQETEEF